MAKKPTEMQAAAPDSDPGTAAGAGAAAPAQPVEAASQDFTKAVNDAVAAYLDANLPDLVAAAMPETPEQEWERAQQSHAEIVAAQTAAATRKAKAAEKAQAKADAAAEEQRAERAASAAKAFAQAEPFVGDVSNIKPGIVRGILIDDGTAYNPDLRFDVRASELEPLTDGSGLLLTKPIELPARAEPFTVQGVSLVTDAGVLRITLNGTRKCGGGKGVLLPARSLLFRPAAAPVALAADAAE